MWKGYILAQFAIFIYRILNCRLATFVAVDFFVLFVQQPSLVLTLLQLMIVAAQVEPASRNSEVLSKEKFFRCESRRVHGESFFVVKYSSSVVYFYMDTARESEYSHGYAEGIGIR